MVGKYCEDDENTELVHDYVVDSTVHSLRAEDKEQASKMEE